MVFQVHPIYRFIEEIDIKREIIQDQLAVKSGVMRIVTGDYRLKKIAISQQMRNQLNTTLEDLDSFAVKQEKR